MYIGAYITLKKQIGWNNQEIGKYVSNQTIG